MKTITDIINACGGDLALAYHLTRHQQTVKRWAKRGIPRNCWGKVSALSGLTHAVIKSIHEKASKR